MRLAVWLLYALAIVPNIGARTLDAAPARVTLFSADPNHLWNRLYSTLFIRTDQAGNTHGVDVPDPLLWDRTNHLLTDGSHQVAVVILNEFLRSHAESQIQDPRKRALLQNRLWAVFDWTASRQ